jgi:hypothetical protein
MLPTRGPGYFGKSTFAIVATLPTYSKGDGAQGTFRMTIGQNPIVSSDRRRPWANTASAGGY